MWWKITITDVIGRKFVVKKTDNGFTLLHIDSFNYSLLTTDEIKDFADWIKGKSFSRIEVEAM